MDLDYAGDAAKFDHLVKFRDYLQGQPNTQLLNFGMKLRAYKNVTTFNAPQPWQYPAKKVFHPDYVYETEKEKVEYSLKNYKESKFNDVSPEKNQSLVISIHDKGCGVYQNTFWNQQLGNGGSKTVSSKFKSVLGGGRPPLAGVLDSARSP